MTPDNILEKYTNKITTYLKDPKRSRNILDQVLINLHTQIFEELPVSVSITKKEHIDLGHGRVDGYEDIKVPGVPSRCLLKLSYTIDIPEVPGSVEHEAVSDIIKFLYAILHEEDQLEKIVEHTIENDDENFPGTIDCGRGISAAVVYQLHTLEADTFIGHQDQSKISVKLDIHLNLDPETKFHKDEYPHLKPESHRRVEP